MTAQLSGKELRALINQTAWFKNAQAILADEWGARAPENPLFQAPVTVSDLQFARDLSQAGLFKSRLDFSDYGAVQRWIAANRSYLTPDDRSWLQRPFE